MHGLFPTDHKWTFRSSHWSKERTGKAKFNVKRQWNSGMVQEIGVVKHIWGWKLVNHVPMSLWSTEREGTDELVGIADLCLDIPRKICDIPKSHSKSQLHSVNIMLWTTGKCWRELSILRKQWACNACMRRYSFTHLQKIMIHDDSQARINIKLALIGIWNLVDHLETSRVSKIKGLFNPQYLAQAGVEDMGWHMPFLIVNRSFMTKICSGAGKWLCAFMYYNPVPFCGWDVIK